MTFGEILVWLSNNLFQPIFGFSLGFAGGVTFGAIIVGIFGLPILVSAFKKLF